MKKIILFAALLCAFSISGIIFTGCGNKQNTSIIKKEKYAEVLNQVDTFVYELDKNYDHYDLYGKHKKDVSSDNKSFSVTPMGRVIIVKVNDVVPDSYYNDVKDNIKKKYENDNRVNDVFINNGGTITIDCRN